MLFLILIHDVSEDMLFLSSDTYGIIYDKKDDVRFIYDFFDICPFFLEIQQTRAIKKSDLPYLFQVGLMAQNISCGSVNIGHNRSELPYQSIEERRFADIGSAY